MSDLEKYLDRVIGHRSNDSEAPQMPMQMPSPIEPEDDVEPTLNIGVALLRRWYIVLLTLVMICSVGVPCVWLFIKRSYVVTGVIQVKPIISNIITGQDDRGGISNYADFMAQHPYGKSREKARPQRDNARAEKGAQGCDTR